MFEPRQALHNVNKLTETEKRFPAKLLDGEIPYLKRHKMYWNYAICRRHWNRGARAPSLTFFKVGTWPPHFSICFCLANIEQTISVSDTDTYIRNIVWNLQVSHLCRDLWDPSYKVGAKPENGPLTYKMLLTPLHYIVLASAVNYLEW